ncbi:hypothetical protein G5I_08441 [Acromyrmex echinatior]|uniref:Uncharacterized protein n=1 Tax=Acromyrmex echinatior TaxID=103372 RepID=F4WRJ1_ACREC|nr:hypothetical protein G5I_08441 [Acromyrmex echinatior]
MILNDNKIINYIHWDLNEIVDRLLLPEASSQLGYNNHDNVILSIIEELCKAVATDFDAKLRKIRRVALPVDDADAANNRYEYVQQSVQNLKDHLNEIKKKIAALQNNVQITLNELEKMIREVHRAE